MQSWWTKKSQNVAQQDNCKQHEEKQKCRNNGSKSKVSKTRTRTNKKKQNIGKPESFDETVIVSHYFSRASLYLKASSIPANAYSLHEMFHSSSEKKAYPLPRPSRSLDLPSVTFNQKGVVFASEPASSSSSPSSGSSTSASLDVDFTGDHGAFASFRAFEESEWDSGLTIPHQGSEASRAEKFQHPQLWKTSTEIQTIKDENWRHLCHPLPLPPYYSCGPSQHLQSKWIKGRLLGRGSFGHVYAGFNRK